MDEDSNLNPPALTVSTPGVAIMFMLFLLAGEVSGRPNIPSAQCPEYRERRRNRLYVNFYLFYKRKIYHGKRSH